MIAETIKSLRENANITQSELGKNLNVTRSSINSWEQGVSVPSTALLVQLAQFFHVSTDYLLGLEQNLTLDISALDETEVKILCELVKHFSEIHK